MLAFTVSAATALLVTVPVVPSTVIFLSPEPNVTVSFNFAVKVFTLDSVFVLGVTVIPFSPFTSINLVIVSLPALVRLLKSFVAELPFKLSISLFAFVISLAFFAMAVVLSPIVFVLD